MLRHIFAIVLGVSAVGAGKASAGNIVPIHGTAGEKHCETEGCFYFEWSLTEAPDIHFVISGFEDGADSYFFRRKPDGSDEVLVHVLNVVRDSKGEYYWGYGWQIEDLPVRMIDQTLKIWTSFGQNRGGDENACYPRSQKRIPTILFLGEKSWKHPPLDWYELTPMALEEIVERSRVVPVLRQSRNRRLQREVLYANLSR